MKKIILLAAYLSSVSIHAMEKGSLLEITKNSLCMLLHGTKINVIKGSIFNPSDSMDLTVVGHHEQDMFKMRYHYQLEIGKIYFPNCKHIYENNQDDESASDDDMYKPYPIPVNQLNALNGNSSAQKQEIWKTGHSRAIKSKILNIGEPCINQICDPNTEGELIKNFTYFVCKSFPNEEDLFIHSQFFNEKAIQEASDDLVLCYKKSLTEGLTQLCSHNKNIAFPTLGADTGFPRKLAAPIAFATVLQWVSDNHKQKKEDKENKFYDNINFFVKKRSDFVLYKKLLIAHCTPKNIYLFYYAHKDSKHFLYQQPLDIINSIIFLCYFC